MRSRLDASCARGFSSDVRKIGGGGKNEFLLPDGSSALPRRASRHRGVGARARDGVVAADAEVKGRRRRGGATYRQLIVASLVTAINGATLQLTSSSVAGQRRPQYARQSYGEQERVPRAVRAVQGGVQPARGRARGSIRAEADIAVAGRRGPRSANDGARACEHSERGWSAGARSSRARRSSACTRASRGPADPHHHGPVRPARAGLASGPLRDRGIHVHRRLRRTCTDPSNATLGHVRVVQREPDRRRVPRRLARSVRRVRGFR